MIGQTILTSISSSTPKRFFTESLISEASKSISEPFAWLSVIYTHPNPAVNPANRRIYELIGMKFKFVFHGLQNPAA